MVYTVTFNPSIDYLFEMGIFEEGRTNRSLREKIFPGGKGINVSIVLHNLGIETTALGFKAGFTGKKIEEMVNELGVESDFIDIKEGMSRINVKLCGKSDTEINASGPQIKTEFLDALLKKLGGLNENDMLVLSGSVPKSVPSGIYRVIMEKIASHKILTVVDAEGDLLTNVIELNPFLIKPNHHELGEIFGVEIKEHSQAVEYARILREKGARNVLVSMGEKGAVLVDELGKVHESAAVKGNIKSTVGSGDSMVAGFIAGWLEKGDYSHAFNLALASGSAGAFSEHLPTLKDIGEVYKKL